MLIPGHRRRLPPLHSLRAFEAAARHSSFKQAAAELAVSPTAVSHQIRLLEDILGLKLFERRARAVQLTHEGKDLYPVLRDVFDAMAGAIARLKSPRLRNTVTVSATVAFTAKWLAPRAPRFHRAHPDLDLRLHASDEPADLLAGVADAAIRYGRGGFAGLASEPLFQDVFAPVCNPSLRIDSPRQLSRQTLIHFEWRQVRRHNPVWPLWLERAGLAGLQPKARLVFTDESHAIQAAIAGHGVALASLLLVSDEIERGTLVQPFGPTLDGYRYWLVYPEGRADSQATGALRKWIRLEMAGRSAASG